LLKERGLHVANILRKVGVIWDVERIDSKGEGRQLKLFSQFEVV
jgi:hypothetical protein